MPDITTTLENRLKYLKEMESKYFDLSIVKRGRASRTTDKYKKLYVEFNGRRKEVELILLQFGTWKTETNFGN